MSTRAFCRYGLQKARTAVLLSLLTVLPAGAVVVGGTVKTEAGRPLPEVIVTDGEQFAFTDAAGRYRMEVSDSAEFVYLITPRGYVADCTDGVPRFWHRLRQQSSSYDFTLHPSGSGSGRSVMLGMADPQVDSDEQVGRLFSETLPDMRQLLDEYGDAEKALFVAGDLTWDNYQYNDRLKRYARELGVPLYPVIGNHDYDKYLPPAPGADYAAVYKQAFGPTYYAFYFGDACYIVLDNIRYEGYKRYTCTLRQGRQWEWLTRLLQVVLQQDTQLFLVMHAPLRYAGDRWLTPEGEPLVRMLAAKPFRAAVFSGHLHTNSVCRLGRGMWEHNLGSAGGFWWTSDYSGDGTPNGYKVVVGERGQYRQFYKSTGHPSSFQLQAYRPGEIAERPTAVCCKVWNYDPRWQVRWYQDGVLQGAMRQFYTFSPEYLRYLDGRWAAGDYVPQRTDHFFSAVPAPGARQVVIEAEDPYGTVYRDTVDVVGFCHSERK